VYPDNQGTLTPQQDAPASPSQDRNNYMDLSIGQMNNLIHGVNAAAGRVMSLATVGSRHVWLGLTALSRKDRDDLLGAPVSADGLFGSITSVTQRFRRLEEEIRSSAACCLWLFLKEESAASR